MDVEQIAPLLERVTDRLNPQEIWLFGSRARGTARPDSDWDLLVIVADESGEEFFDPMKLWRLLRHDEFGADVVVFPRSEFDEDRSTPNTLPFVVAREGVRVG
jgi:predicted nucleotidyltransferase